MEKIKSAVGYSIAFLSVILAFATFASDGMIGKELVKRGNLVVSPNMYGGEIIKTIQKDGYRVVVRKPVFQGLFKPKKEGFIQVDFLKEENVPQIINEDIDFDDDKKIDFRIQYNTGTDHTEVTSFHPGVSTRFMGIKQKSAHTVRISATNPDY